MLMVFIETKLRSLYEGLSLYEGAKTRVRVGLELSKEFKVKVGVHQGSVLLPLVFAILVDVVTKSVRNGVI